MLDFNGLSCAPFAPMNEDGSINPSLIPRYATYLQENKIKGVFVNGTTGEGNYSLTLDERLVLAEAWMKEREKIEQIVIQVGGCNFTEAKILAAHAEKIGADGIGILPNCFEKPHSLDDLIDWVARIAHEAPNTPCLYYHLPKYTNVHFPMDEFLSRGSKVIPTLSGMKYSTTDLGDAAKCLSLRRPADGKPFLILFGSDDTFLGHYSIGMEAAIGSTYNFAPKLFHDLVAALKSGDLESARRFQDQVASLFRAFSKYGPGTSPQKYVMTLLSGLPMGHPRFPLKQLSDETVAQMKSELLNLGIDFAFKTA